MRLIFMSLNVWKYLCCDIYCALLLLRVRAEELAEELERTNQAYKNQVGKPETAPCSLSVSLRLFVSFS